MALLLPNDNAIYHADFIEKILATVSFAAKVQFYSEGGIQYTNDQSGTMLTMLVLKRCFNRTLLLSKRFKVFTAIIR
jgi:hypothetical protein